VTAQDIERMAQRFMVAGDASDVLAARDTLTHLLGLHPYEA
jgi:hypothetical protein